MSERFEQAGLAEEGALRTDRFRHAVRVEKEPFSGPKFQRILEDPRVFKETERDAAIRAEEAAFLPDQDGRGMTGIGVLHPAGSRIEHDR